MQISTTILASPGWATSVRGHRRLGATGLVCTAGVWDSESLVLPCKFKVEERGPTPRGSEERSHLWLTNQVAGYILSFLCEFNSEA